MPGSLVRVPTVRADGVKTHVWRKMDSSPTRASTLPPPSTAARPATKGTSAVTSALAFDPRTPHSHPLPRWWKKNAIRDKDILPKHLKSYPINNTPKIIDVFDSPVGKITVTWLDGANDLLDRGYRVSRLAFHNEQGDQIGYLKAACVTDETYEWTFGDDEFAAFRQFAAGNNLLRTELNFHGYWARNENKGKVPPRPNDREIEDVYRSLWADAMRIGRRSVELPDGSIEYGVNIKPEYSSHLSLDEVKREVERFRQDHVQEKYEMWRGATSPLTPFIDYSNIEHQYQGIGLGTALYIYAAKQLSLEGAVLRGSGVQSEKAQSTWVRFRRDMPERIVEVSFEYLGETKKNPALDFR